MVIVTGTVAAGTLLVGGGIGVAAAAVGTGALYYKYRKMNKRKLSKTASNGLFGAVLDTIDPKYIDEATGIPRVIQDIFKQIETSGITTKSIFHAPGDVPRIKALQKLFEEAAYDQLHLHEESTHDLCALVALYFQRLPEPLCTLLLYADFLAGHQKYAASHDEWVEKMRKLFDTLPEMNKRLLIRSLQFFSAVGEEEANQVSKSYLVHLLGPLFFYDQSEGEEEDGEGAQLHYDSKPVYELFMELLVYHKELFPLPLEEMPPWKDSREFDSVSRSKKGKKGKKTADGKEPNLGLPSFLPPTDEEKAALAAQGADEPVEETIPEASETGTPVLKKKKKKGGVISNLKFSKLKQQYLGELPTTAPANTIPVNYVMPAGY